MSGNETNKTISIKLDHGKRLIVLMTLMLQTLMIGLALLPATWLLITWGPRFTSSLGWTLLILGAIFIFNYMWLLELLVLRMIIPVPKEGFYRRDKDGRPPREAIVYMLNATLARLRFSTPWARNFTSPLSDLPPLSGVYRKLFGPHTTSIVPGDSAFILDPSLVTAGSNVQFGFASIITCHFFDQRGMFVKRVTIGNDVLVGGDSIICPGVQIGDHAVIAARSFVPPNTIIGSYEYWAGSPAVKVKDLPRQTEDVSTVPHETPAVLPERPAGDDLAASV